MNTHAIDSLPPITVDTPEEYEVLEGVKQTLYWWGRCLSGRDSVLLAHSLVTPDLMPGAPGQLKTIGRGTVSDRSVTVRREGKHRLEVRIDFTDGEARAFCERDIALTAAKDAEARVKRLPASVAGYRERAALAAVYIRRYMAELGTTPAGGFHFDDETVEEINDLLAEVSELVATAKIQYSPARRWEEEARIHVTSVAESEKRGSRWARIMEKRPAD